jgi:PAS domain S-box-containing protein
VSAVPTLPQPTDSAVLAARTLALFAGGAGLLAAALAASTQRTEVSAPALSAVLLAYTGLVAVLHLALGRLRPRWVIVGILLLGQGAAAGFTVVAGEGLHAVSIGATALLVVLAGVLVGSVACLALAGSGGLMALALFAAERKGAWGLAPQSLASSIDALLVMAALLSIAALAGVLLSRMYLRALRAAADNSRRTEALLRVGSDWVWEQDRHGRITHISEGFARASGVPVQAMLGRRWDEVPGLAAPEGGWAPLVAALSTVIHGGQGLRHHVLRAPDASGRMRVLRLSLLPAPMSPVEGHGQRADLWLGVGQDITVQAAAAQEDEQRRAEAAIVFDHASIGITLVRQHRFVRVNPQLERLLGHAPGALLGQPVSSIVPDAGAYDELDTHARLAFGQGQVHEAVLQMARRDAQPFTGRVRGQLIPASASRPASVVWLIEDITERERVASALAHARDEALAANRAKSRFLATMSHEMRTPLNGVLGMIRLAQQLPADDARRGEYLQHALDSGATLASIIGDVLDLARIEAGRLQLEVEDFDLHELVHQIARGQQAQAVAKGLAFEAALMPGLPRWVYGDALRLRQVMLNLLGNAIKFTETGVVRLHVSAARAGWVRVEVQDSGPGIAEAALERLFTPFEQGEASTSSRQGGTGLGLSICRELAGLMGGEVGVNSTLGQGSRFWAELPLSERHEATRSADGVAGAPALPLQGVQVLVVEDNPVNMLIASETLKRWGAEVHEAEDGAQALARLAPGHGIDVVLMDVNMPVLGGVQATEALRAAEHTRSLPIIALTAAALASEQRQALQAGMDDFVAKPIEPELLLAAVQRARQRATL